MLNFLLLLNLYFCAFSNTCLKAVFSIYKVDIVHLFLPLNLRLILFLLILFV